MFEFTTKSGNKVKIINVTEARGNFAAILSDIDSHYIITKNNKPLRVIINYSDFQTLQEFLGDVTPDMPLAPIAAKECAENLDTEAEIARLKRSKTPAVLKGILAAQIELSQQGEPVLPEPEGSGEFNLEDVPPLATETAAASNFLGGEVDYFKNDGETSEGLDKILPEPEGIVKNLVLTESESAAAQAQTPVAEEGTDIQEQELPAKTPEEQAYFERYRKLYENHPAHDSSFSATGSAVEPDLDIELSENSASSHESLGSELFKQLSVDKPGVSDEEAESRRWDDSFATTELTTDEREHLNELTEDAPVTGQKSPADEVLPSLQQLLKDLEGERLSGEESEALDSEDIDEIINRITSD